MERAHGLESLEVQYTFEQLRSDSRYANLLKRMGLPQ